MKRGDVIILVDMLLEVTSSNNDNNELISKPEGYVDYVRNNTGKMFQRTILLSNIILPPMVEGVCRDRHIPCEVLDSSQRFQGLDIYRTPKNYIDKLREIESDIFSIDN